MKRASWGAERQRHGDGTVGGRSPASGWMVPLVASQTWTWPWPARVAVRDWRLGRFIEEEIDVAVLQDAVDVLDAGTAASSFTSGGGSAATTRSVMSGCGSSVAKLRSGAPGSGCRKVRSMTREGVRPTKTTLPPAAAKARRRSSIRRLDHGGSRDDRRPGRPGRSGCATRRRRGVQTEASASWSMWSKSIWCSMSSVTSLTVTSSASLSPSHMLSVGW